jgi:hypothetical protein
LEAHSDSSSKISDSRPVIKALLADLP